MTATAAGEAVTALRGAAMTFAGDPFAVPEDDALVFESDALVVMRDGRIMAFGPADTLLPSLPPAATIVRYPNALLVPGFVDAHVHFPQLPIIGACGRTLLDWLEHCTFVVEQRFADPAFAAVTAEAYLDECLRQGITTAVVYGTVHPGSVDAFFTAAQARDMRMIAGKVLMDRHAPAGLVDTPQRGYDESKALIGRWHGRGRLAYAVTPRFAATSSPEQLDAAGALVREHRGVYLQTHLAETRDEVGWVKKLFPERAIISTSTRATGSSAGAAFSGTESTLPTTRGSEFSTPARRSRIARRRTTFSAAAFFASAMPSARRVRLGWRWRRTSAAARRCRCWPRWPRPTRLRGTRASG